MHDCTGGAYGVSGRQIEQKKITVETDYRSTRRFTEIRGQIYMYEKLSVLVEDPERTHDLPLRRSYVSISVQASCQTWIETLSEQLHAPLLLFLADTICCNGRAD